MTGEISNQDAESDEPDQDAESDEPGRQTAPIPRDEAHLGTCTVEVRLQVPETRPPCRHWLECQLVRVTALIGLRGGTLSVLVVDNVQMSQMHESYRRRPSVTDVLSFDLRENPGDSVAGDLLLCADVADREAAQRGHSTRVELLLYAVHGLLHLLGHDDQDPHRATQMHRREDELLIELGIGPVFSVEKRDKPDLPVEPSDRALTP